MDNMMKATPPYKAAFTKGVINQLAPFSGSNQDGHVMYTSFQYRSAHTESGALKVMRLITPQNIGTQKPTIAQMTQRRIMAPLLHCYSTV